MQEVAHVQKTYNGKNHGLKKPIMIPAYNWDQYDICKLFLRNQIMTSKHYDVTVGKLSCHNDIIVIMHLLLVCYNPFNLLYVFRFTEFIDISKYSTSSGHCDSIQFMTIKYKLEADGYTLKIENITSWLKHFYLQDGNKQPINQLLKMCVSCWLLLFGNVDS